MSAATRREPALRRSIATAATGTTLFRLTGAIGGILSARLLGPAGKGQYAVLVLLGTALGTGGTLGLEFWVAREVARQNTTGLVAAVIRRHLSVFAVVTAVAVAVAVLAELGTGTDLIAEIVGVGLLSLVTVTSMLYLALPNGSLDMRRFALATVASGLVYLAWVVVLLVADIRSVAWVLFGAAAGGAVVIPFCRPFVRRYSAESTRTSAANAYRGAIRFGAPAALGELVTLATFRTDVVLVALLLGPAEAGLYAVALALVEVLWVIPDGVAQVLLPHVARDPSREDTGRLLRLVFALTATGGAVLVIVDRILITTVFGASFRGAATAVPFLVVGAIAIGLWKMVAADVIARTGGRPRVISALSGLVVMVGADLVLIRPMGIAGAAAASTLGYLVAFAHVTLHWQRTTGLPLAALLRSRKADLDVPERPATTSVGDSDQSPRNVGERARLDAPAVIQSQL